MYNPLNAAKEAAKKLIVDAIDSAVKAGTLPQAEIPEFIIEQPADSSHGDFAANAAMVCAKAFHMAPRAIAAAIAENVSLDNTEFEKIEVAGPGFINLFLGSGFYRDAVEGILREGDNFGRTDWGKGKKYMVEFVSANPTGPMHLGNARGGALGDCLASVLDFAGCDVTREFYVNDAGNQIEKFAVSLEARYLALYREGIEFPEDGYHGEDITEHAKNFVAIHGDKYVDCDARERKDALVAYALPLNIERMHSDLSAYRIEYDNWFYESVLHNDGTIDKIIDILRSKNAIYEKDGALWYRATDFGGEKDEVLVRSNGYPTYFAADIAYHYNKFQVRGYDVNINVWGADHHGHVARLKGAMDAIGLDGDRLDIVLMQLVKLLQDGEPVKMSKRTGKAITLSTLLEEVPVDAARFFFNLREPKSHLEFDLTLAAKQSSDNPVYYVQYAHARICSILKSLQAAGISTDKADIGDCCRLATDDEKALIRLVASLPQEINKAADEYDPAKITRFTIDVATAFHRFYTNCRVRCDDEELMRPRIALCLAAKQVLSNCLGLLKITAPESM